MPRSPRLLATSALLTLLGCTPEVAGSPATRTVSALPSTAAGVALPPPAPVTEPSEVAATEETAARPGRGGPRSTMQPRPSIAIDEVLRFEGGEVVGHLAPDAARAEGLALVDLRATWVPRVLAPDPALGARGAQPYVTIYEVLADEHFPRNDPNFDRARRDRYLELYGIFPTMRVHRARLADETRHVCHDEVDDDALARMTHNVLPFGDMRSRVRRAHAYRAAIAELRAARDRAHVATDAELRSSASVRKARATVARFASEVEPIFAVQAHLRCERFLGRHADPGVFDAYTVDALRIYQRRHMIVSNGRLDAATRRTMVTDSRELDFRALLRALRERVADATGIIEDGSAPGVSYPVLGRPLEPTPFQELVVAPPIPDGAPDLLGVATERAAVALGFTDPHASLEALDRFGDAARTPPVVAIALPPPPAYHRPDMDLRVVIDRGDVWYDYPFIDGERRRHFRIERRPTLTLYARVDGHDLALARYGTTIGGWQKERFGQGIRWAYKNSDVGPRVIRDVVASPAWLPPPSTPDDELIRLDPRDGPQPKLDTVGPSYASAYGLAMMVHLREVPNPAGGPPFLYDYGIREHGSANYTSILRGESHGCHRLFNHLSLRLTSFVLAHRNHVRRGSIAAAFSRRISGHGQTFELRIRTRGYFHELTPPIRVDVLEGRVRGHVRRPPPGSSSGGRRIFHVGETADEESAGDVEGEAGDSDARGGGRPVARASGDRDPVVRADDAADEGHEIADDGRLDSSDP